MTITDLGRLRGSKTHLTALNDHGHVLGTFAVPDSSDNPFEAHSFLWKDGKIQDIGPVFGKKLNNLGQVAGFLVPSHAEDFNPGFFHSWRPVLWTDDHYQDLLPPGATFGSAEALNDQGQVVGQAGTMTKEGETRKVDIQLFVWHDGRIDYLPIPPEYISGVPKAINHQGQVVGILQKLSPGSVFPHRFAALWEGESVEALTLSPGFHQTSAVAINAHGQILVEGHLSESTEKKTGKRAGFLWHAGQITLIRAGDDQIIPRGLNDRGQIVGQLTPNGEKRTTSLKSRAFLWQDDQIMDLNTMLPDDSGWVLTDAKAINAPGQIIGSGKRDGKTHAYLLTPA